jgi:hypothetical protein
MGELPPGFDPDNLDELLAALTPEMAEYLGLEGGGDGGFDRSLTGL